MWSVAQGGCSSWVPVMLAHSVGNFDLAPEFHGPFDLALEFCTGGTLGPGTNFLRGWHQFFLVWHQFLLPRRRTWHQKIRILASQTTQKTKTNF